MFKIILLLSTTMTMAASSPSVPSRSINSHRHSTETITITVDKDSPSKSSNLADTLNSLTAQRVNTKDGGPKEIKLAHPCCNTKVKLAIIAGVSTMVTAGISAAATYYTKSCT